MSYLHSLAQAGLIGSLIFSSCATVTGQDPDQPKKVVITFEIDDGPLRIVIRGDDVKVELDGKEIARDRIEIEGNWLQIKNKSGWPVAFGSFSKDNFGFNFLDAPKVHAWLGVDLRSVSEALAGHLRLDRDEVSQVVSVTPDSPAETGGLRDHDIILEFDGRSPATGEDLRELLADKEPGDMLTISLLRKGKEQELEIELGESPSRSWPGTGFSSFLLGGGKGGVYTVPNIKGSWIKPNLLNYDKATGAYKVDQLLFRGKNRDGKDKKSSKKDGADNRYSVVTPQGVLYDVTAPGFSGVLRLGKALGTGKSKTLLLPDAEVYSILGGAGQGLTIGTQAKDTGSTKALAKQLSDLAKQLDALKALVEKQQAKAKRRDN